MLEFGIEVAPAEVSVGALEDRILATRAASAVVVPRDLGMGSVLQRNQSISREAADKPGLHGTYELSLFRPRDDERAPLGEGVLQAQLAGAFRVQPVVQILQLCHRTKEVSLHADEKADGKKGTARLSPLTSSSSS